MNTQKLLLLSTRLFITAWAASLLTTFISVPAVYAQANQTVPTSSTDADKLAAMEQHLFFKTYPEEAEDLRLTRIEKEVFGEPGTGDIPSRVNRAMSAINIPQNNFSSSYGSPPPTSSSSSNSNVNSTPMPSTNDSITPANNTQNGQDMESNGQDSEQAKVAVQAAREQEISQLLSQGVDLWRHKKKTEAIDKFNQVLSLDPHNAGAHFSMGIVYESDNNFAEADSQYKQALLEKPSSHEYQDAVKSVEKKMRAANTINSNPETQALAENAAAAYQRGEFFSALDLYKQLDAKAPNQAVIKYNIGSLYLQMDRAKDAYEYYKQAEKLKPDEPRYKQAVEKLKTNMKADEQSRKQAESAWNNKGGSAGSAPPVAPAASRNFKKPKVPKTEEVMAGFGIFGKNSHDGVQITNITGGSRAANAGMQVGDIVKAVNGTVVNNPAELNNMLLRNSGVMMQVTVQRGQQIGMINL